MTTCENNKYNSKFTSILKNTPFTSLLDLQFGAAFVFTVETGFIPTSLAEHFDSINPLNIELTRMIDDGLKQNSFWHRKDNIFIAELVMSNQLCHLIGIPNGESLIITLSHSDISKCTIIEIEEVSFKKTLLNCFYESLQFKNAVSVPIKCAILEITTGKSPSLCGIPEELILYIMSKLDVSSVYALMRCCKKLNYLAVNNQFLWKTLLNEELKDEESDQRFFMQQPIVDWRNYYYEFKRNESGRTRVTIIR